MKSTLSEEVQKIKVRTRQGCSKSKIIQNRGQQVGYSPKKDLEIDENNKY
jgi:hypothetical protein